LPQDITREELKAYFVRCGVFRLDPVTGEDQIRIYSDDNDVPKGDARIGFAKIESVDIAVEMLNETEIRPNYKISVT
jgi:HIV Tat-specific factor 1